MKEEDGWIGIVVLVVFVLLLVGVLALPFVLAKQEEDSHKGMTCVASHIAHTDTWVQPIIIGNSTSVIVHPGYDSKVCDKWEKNKSVSL